MASRWIKEADGLRFDMTGVIRFGNGISLMANRDEYSYRTWQIATVAGTFSLFPLLFKASGEWRLS